MKALFLSLIFVLISVNSYACGEKNACPASDCDKQACSNYVNREGEYANRPRLRCIDLCDMSCRALIKGELKDKCSHHESQENDKSESEKN